MNNSIRVDLIDSALNREDEGNDLARDGTSYCTSGGRPLGSGDTDPALCSKRISSDRGSGCRECVRSREEGLLQRGSEISAAAESPGRSNGHREGTGVEVRGSLLHIV